MSQQKINTFFKIVNHQSFTFEIFSGVGFLNVKTHCFYVFYIILNGIYLEFWTKEDMMMSP